MEGYSVEDKGDGISFNVYCYNVQPGVTIDYATGRSCRSGETLPPVSNETEPPIELTGVYILNTNSKKIHKTDCKNAVSISESNKKEFSGDISELASQGYTCCSICLKDVELPSPETKPETKQETKAETPAASASDTNYVLNTDSKKIHHTDCYHVKSLSESKRKDHTGDISELLENGYTTCGACFE